jgi:NADH-quinone oxidoreductase subunit D
MGPQHPATHGVLRLHLELEGETIRRVKPIIGYLHTGMEKTAETLPYISGGTNVTRMDYLSPLNNELCYSLAVEQLLRVEIPARAQAIRVLMTELNRIASHLIWVATFGMDIGALSMMIYGFREREAVLAFFEKVTGLRMNHNYIRPGGEAGRMTSRGSLTPYVPVSMTTKICSTATRSSSTAPRVLVSSHLRRPTSTVSLVPLLALPA